MISVPRRILRLCFTDGPQSCQGRAPHKWGAAHLPVGKIGERIPYKYSIFPMTSSTGGSLERGGRTPAISMACRTPGSPALRSYCHHLPPLRGRALFPDGESPDVEQMSECSLDLISPEVSAFG